MNIEQKERLKRQDRYDKAKGCVAVEEAERGTPGDASDHFIQIDKADANQSRWMIVSRVSSYGQAKRGDLMDQERSIKRKANEIGINVVGHYRHVGRADDPTWLKRVVRRANKLGATGLLFESTCRSIRHQKAHKGRSNYDWMPREIEYQAVKAITGDLILATINDPNATMGEIRSLQSQRGKLAKNSRKGGRPVAKTSGYRKRIRFKYQQEALELHSQGMGTRRIANHISKRIGLNVSHMTVFKWVKAANASSL